MEAMAFNGGNFKLTVCFETIRIVVPCGNGELLVKDLTELAVSRYRKAIGKVRTTPLFFCYRLPIRLLMDG